MSEINQVFNDIYFGARILSSATRLRDTLELKRDNEIDLAQNEEEKEEIANNYKRRLQSIYRIRNNVYALLLKSGFTCSYKEQEDGSKIFYMNIEGTTYDCMENAIKNILGKEYTEIVKKCLPDDVYQKILKEENEKLLEANKIKAVEKNKNKEIVSTTLADNMLAMLEEEYDTVDVKSNNLSDNQTEKQISAPSSNPIEQKKVEPNKKTAKATRCTRCFAPLSEGQTVCDFCGYDLNAKKVLSREEMNAMDAVDEFSEEDIDKMFEELEKRLNDLENKSDKPSTTNTNNNTDTLDAEDFETVRLYNPEKSEPMKKRSEMIMDIYTLKLKDPKDENQKKEEVKEEHRRKRKNEIDIPAPVIEEEDDDFIREVKIYVYPLSVPESGTELSSEILVYITQDGACGSFCSELTGINTVRVNTNIHNFIVRGQWENGNFITKVISNGKTLVDNCEIERIKEEIRPDDIIAAKLGHPITFLSVEYVDGTETLKIHAVPIADENDYDGYAKTLYLMENVNLRERKLFITKSTNYITFEFEDEIYKASAKWKENTFKMKVENY